MPRPNTIILVRHGQSVGNVDKSVYEHTPDWQVPLTDKGYEQAMRAGDRVAKAMSDIRYEPSWLTHRDPAIFYTSPWLRARQTCQTIRSHISGLVSECRVLEDPRLREQEWGNYQDLPSLKRVWRERDKFGKFFYRMPDGESGADVYDRVSTFLETLHRDFGKVDYPRNCIVVTHGLTMRVFLMRWFHWSVEEYDALRNPPNGGIVVMRKGGLESYYLETRLRKRALPYEKKG